MSNICYCCGGDFSPNGHKCDFFFIWSTSRGFPIEKLFRIKKVKGRLSRNRIFVEGEKVCLRCHRKLVENE